MLKLVGVRLKFNYKSFNNGVIQENENYIKMINEKGNN